MDGGKRPGGYEGALTVAAKRARVDDGSAVVVSRAQESLAVASAGNVHRTSSLSAPTMLLTGHGDAVMSLKFSPSGQALASGSRDKSVNLWNVWGDCKVRQRPGYPSRRPASLTATLFHPPCLQNYMVLNGHHNAVLEVQWSGDGERLLSCSADKTVRAWDAETGQPVKKMAEHSAIVNSVCPARGSLQLVVSGSDDGTTRLWDLRVRKCVQRFDGGFAVTAVAFNDAADGVFSGGIDNVVRCHDLRTGEVSMTLSGHKDTITGMAVSPDGNFLLSNAMDQTLRVWDVRPYAPQERCTRVIKGHAHNFEKNLLRCAWSPDGSKVTCGSADRMVYVWSADGTLQYKLPGHKGSVNEAVMHPKEPIVASCSSDSTIYMGELAL